MELSEFIESAGEWESESEAAEAARGRGAPRRPSPQPSFKPRPAAGTPQYVTQAQLEAALARSDAKVKTVADGVSTISARVNAVTSATRKEADERKKALDTTNKDLNQKMQLMAMLPVLITPKTKTVLDIDGVTQDEVVVADDSSLNKLLPLLLMTGMGSAGGFGTSGDGSADGGNSMMMMAMVLALGR
jgi:hypothetical protein